MLLMSLLEDGTSMNGSDHVSLPYSGPQLSSIFPKEVSDVGQSSRLLTGCFVQRFSGNKCDCLDSH